MQAGYAATQGCMVGLAMGCRRRVRSCMAARHSAIMSYLLGLVGGFWVCVLVVKQAGVPWNPRMRPACIHISNVTKSTSDARKRGSGAAAHHITTIQAMLVAACALPGQSITTKHNSFIARHNQDTRNNKRH